MHGVGTLALRRAPGGRVTPEARAVGLGALAVALTYASLIEVTSASRVPQVWPVAGVLAGAYLTSPGTWRRWVLVAAALGLTAAHLASGYPVVLAAGYSLSSVASAYVVRLLLTRGLGERRVGLFEEGDVSRMIGSIAAASTVSAAGYAAVSAVTGTGNVGLAALAAWGGHAAGMMMLLPLFVRTTRFATIATRNERMVQAVITLATTVALFSLSDFPPIIFAVMPMFSWHAYRGSLREATLVLAGVGVIATVLTRFGIGPIYGLAQRYSVPSEVSGAVLQLFLLDCGLVLLPLSVMLTQQRKSAALARKERVTLERLVDAATGTAVIATDVHGQITLFNPAAESITGCARADVVGRSPERFFSDEELVRQSATVHAGPSFGEIAEAMVELGVGSRLWRIQRADGEERTLRMTLTAVTDEHGGHDGFLATAEDVTEREGAHRALLATLEHERNAVEQLRKLERVKGDFVATVSHELRTPITSIMGYTEVLEDGAYGALSDGQLEILGRVDRNSRRLLTLVEDLLTLSQIESSTLKLETTDLDLRAVVEGAHEAVEQRLAGRELRVRVVLPTDPVAFRGDGPQLERMLINLLTNAVKFTPDGGTVDVLLHDDSELYEIVVRDTGLGIPLSEQSQLFTRFFRSTTATREAIQGTGLGLSIVQAIVTLHGGTIAVSSAPDRGTTFTVRLPRVRFDEEAGADVIELSA